jgi:hypothetical protein
MGGLLAHAQQSINPVKAESKPMNDDESSF